MIKIYSLFTFLLITLMDCKTPNDDVEIKILNNEIYYNLKSDPWNGYVYSDEIERQKSMTILTWKIVNNSKENYLFIINEDDLLSNPFKKARTDLFEITTPDEKMIHGGISDVMAYKNEPANFKMIYDCEQYHDSIEEYIFNRKRIKSPYKYPQQFYRKFAFILHPNESKTFQTILKLPIISEMTPRNEVAYYRNLKDGYLFKLTYELDFKKLSEFLEDYQMEEIKSNNTKIFQGRLVSNSVQLKGR